MKNDLSRLKSVVEQLAQDAGALDEANKQRKSNYYLQDQPLFDEKLFPIASASYYAYVKYTQQRIEHLEVLLQSKQKEFCDALLQQLEEQITALIKAIKANDSRYHDSQYRLDRRNRLNKQKTSKYKKAAKKVLMSSHQLHEKLSEYRGFERRLEEMIRVKDQQLKISKKHDTNAMQLEVLTLHQRLGRCRKAINDIEKQIEFSEKSR